MNPDGLCNLHIVMDLGSVGASYGGKVVLIPKIRTVLGLALAGAVTASAHAQTPFRHSGADTRHATYSPLPHEQIDLDLSRFGGQVDYARITPSSFFFIHEKMMGVGAVENRARCGFPNPCGRALGVHRDGSVHALCRRASFEGRRAAGVAQVRAGTSLPEFGHPLGGAPYGDDPRDQLMISKGYSFAADPSTCR